MQLGCRSGKKNKPFDASKLSNSLLFRERTDMVQISTGMEFFRVRFAARFSARISSKNLTVLRSEEHANGARRA